MLKIRGIISTIALSAVSVFPQNTISTLLSTNGDVRDTIHVSVFAGGEVSTAFTDRSKTGNIGNGAIGMSLTKKRLYFYAFTNIGTEGDTITNKIGRSIIDPVSSIGPFNSLLLEVRIYEAFNIPFTNYKMGIQVPASISNVMWGKTDSTGMVLQAKDAIVGSLTIATFYAISGKMDETTTDIGFLLSAGITMRGLGGDVFANKFYESITGTKSKLFFGPTAGAIFQLGYIKAGIQVVKLFDPHKNKKIEGLTFTHINGTIGISAPMFEGVLKKRA